MDLISTFNPLPFGKFAGHSISDLSETDQGRMYIRFMATFDDLESKFDADAVTVIYQIADEEATHDSIMSSLDVY